MTETARQARWEAQPQAARAVRALAFLLPFALGLVAALVTRSFFEEPATTGEQALVVAVTSAAATVAVALGTLASRSIHGLAALLRLSLGFPGERAPSRVRAALGTGRHPIALVARLDRRDRRMRGHAERVRGYSRLIADQLGFDETKLDLLDWAALLHDAGKLAVPAPVLRRRGALADDARELLAAHPAEGRALISFELASWLGEWAGAVDQHHERWDGTGYPDRLAGEDIALGARIVAVADTFDALTSAHSYKRPISVEAACDEIERCAGSQFDPTVVRAFSNVEARALRSVMGPTAWLTQQPAFRPLPVAPMGMTAVGVLAGLLAALATAVGGTGGAAPAQVAERADTTVVAASDAPAVFEAAGPADEPTTTTTSTTTTSTTSTTVAPTTTTTPTQSAGGGTPTGSGNGDGPPVPPARRGGGTATRAPAATDAPRVVDEGVILDEDAVAVVDVLANDHGVGLVAVGPPPFGKAAVVDGLVVYEPPANWSGVTVVQYLVRTPIGQPLGGNLVVEVRPVADDPTADTEVAVTAEDQAVVIDVLAGDGDPDGEPLTVVGVSDPAHGTATVDASGTVTYVPDRDADADESFTYEVADPTGRRATGAVDVDVVPVNDAPVLDAGPLPVTDQDAGPVALRGWLDAAPGPASEAGQQLTTTVSVDRPELFAAVPTLDADGTLRFTSAPGAVGFTNLTITASDDGGTADGGVDVATLRRVLSLRATRGPIPADDAVSFAEDAGPVTVPVLANDGDRGAGPLRVTAVRADGFALGKVTATGSAVTVAADPDENGTATFTYTVADAAGLTATGTVTVTIAPVADAPTAGDDGYATTSGTPLRVGAPGLLGNDGDHDGDPVTVSTAPVDAPDAGSLTLRADGSFTYTPDAGFVGTDAFTYRVADGTGRTDTALVRIRVGATPASTLGLYLGTGSPDVPVWGMGAVMPSGSGGVELDRDGDGRPGLTIGKGYQDLLSGAEGEYHDWINDPDGTLVLDGPVTLELWSTVEDFDATADADWSVGLYDCQLGGGSCTSLAAQHRVHVESWNAGDSGWVRRDLNLGSVQYTVAPGHQLRVRVMVGHEPVWVAVGGTRPSRLVLTTG